VKPIYGGIEAGGTKVVCAVGRGPDELLDEVRIPTTGPDETLAQVVAWFAERGPLDAVGVGCFGPVDLDRGSATYGHVTTTPKAGWSRVDVAGTIGRGLGVPVGFDTDVNAAALGEGTWGAAQGLDTFVYLTVGTGIGGGGMVRGRLMHGLVHPEMGHMRVRRDARDPYDGCCPYHGDCLEGLASGPAVEERWGARGETLPPGHQAWELEVQYLAQGVCDLVCVLSPQRVILGGGVMAQAHLFEGIRRRTGEMLAGYVQSPAILERMQEFIVAPALGERAGVLGGFALAAQAAEGG
jgi:fructokinase